MGHRVGRHHASGAIKYFLDTSTTLFFCLTYKPYNEFNPTLHCSAPLVVKNLHLAHCSISGKEHYDAYECIKSHAGSTECHHHFDEDTELVDDELLCDVMLIASD